MKKFIFMIIIMLSLSNIFPLFVNAQPTADSYVMIAKGTPLSSDSSGKTDMATFLPAIFKLGIGIAGALAVIYIIVGGFQYLSTDAINGKEEGKERINNALIGLILAISAYTILNTINPKLVNLNLSIETLPQGTPISTTGSGDGNCSNNIKDGNETGTDTGGRCGDGTNGNCFNGIKDGDEVTADVGGRCPTPPPPPGGTNCSSSCADIASASPSIPHKTPAQNGCHLPGPCFVEAQMLTELQSLAQKMNVRQWQVTEMYPPTVGHADPCHNHGTCVDATVGDRSDNGLKFFFQAIRDSGASRYIYEVCGARLLELQSKSIFNEFKPKLIITCPGTTTGESVHIEQ